MASSTSDSFSVGNILPRVSLCSVDLDQHLYLAINDFSTLKEKIIITPDYELTDSDDAVISRFLNEAHRYFLDNFS